MKPLPPICVGQRPGYDRQGQQGEALERFVHPFSARSQAHQPPSRQANPDANENAESDLLHGEAYPDACGQVLLLGLRQGQEKSQKRHGQTVVEAGLHVKGLADARGDAGVAHDRLAQGRVGGGEDGSHDRGLPER